MAGMTMNTTVVPGSLRDAEPAIAPGAGTRRGAAALHRGRP
jgi:hypothetical protein